jgi:hypothetical protein
MLLKHRQHLFLGPHSNVKHVDAAVQKKTLTMFI